MVKIPQFFTPAAPLGTSSEYYRLDASKFRLSTKNKPKYLFFFAKNTKIFSRGFGARKYFSSWIENGKSGKILMEISKK